MSKALAKRKTTDISVSSRATHFKKVRAELALKSEALRAEYSNVKSEVEGLAMEKTEWLKRASLAKEDLKDKKLSETGKQTITRLLAQAETAAEVVSEELSRAKTLLENMNEQMTRNKNTLNRLDNIEYELALEENINGRRRELGMSNNSPKTDDTASLMREVKQSEYAIDALIKLRNSNEN